MKPWNQLLIHVHNNLYYGLTFNNSKCWVSQIAAIVSIYITIVKRKSHEIWRIISMSWLLRLLSTYSHTNVSWRCSFNNPCFKIINSPLLQRLAVIKCCMLIVFNHLYPPMVLWDLEKLIFFVGFVSFKMNNLRNWLYGQLV